MLIFLSLSMLLTRQGLTVLPDLQTYLISVDITETMNSAIRYSATMLVLFPPTFILGGLFPLNLKLYCGELKGVRNRIGKGYAINTLAGIAGAIFAGFIAIPSFGTDVLLLGLVIVTALSALLWVPIKGYSLVSGVISLLVTGCMIISYHLPGIDYKSLIASVGYHKSSKKGEEPDFVYLEEGKAGVISLVNYGDGYYTLQNNGLNESSLVENDDTYSLRAEFMLGVLPYMINENAKSAFVVGFGSGHTTRSIALTDVSRIKVVELEPAVVRADQSINSFVSTLLEDERINLHYNDARNELLVGKEKYDIIASQPSHPWVAGAANVFTKQFWQITKDKLNAGGVFSQWINLF